MLSWRLWKTVAEPITKNPIFNRVRDRSRVREQSRPIVQIPRYVYIIILVFLMILIIRMPHIFIMLMQIPALLVAVVILSPLAMPLFVIIAGTYVVSRITVAINKEKRQYTYELLCAAPDGSLNATWIFATGILHRGNWFNWLKFLTHLIYRVAQVILLGLGVVTVISFFSISPSDRIESARTLINLVLVVALYYTSMIQPIVFSLVVGIYATSLNTMSRRDSSFIGIFMYLLLQLLPLVIALLLFIVLNTVVVSISPILQLGIDVIVLSSIILIRELMLNVMWWQLRQKLNSTTDYTILPPPIASVAG